MKLNKQIYVWLLPVLLSLPHLIRAQEIQGTVYDISLKIPLPYVSVMTTSGNGTQTDSTGFYSIRVTQNDSIWFSYLEKQTPKYPVSTIHNPGAFDISIQMSAIELPNVTVKKPNYHLDSLQNRKEYEKIFNYRKPGLRVSALAPNYPYGGVGVDLDELINVFRFRRNRNMKFIQNWLIQEEQDKYVDYRFNKIFVKKLTSLEDEQLNDFMKFYRPTYEFVVTVNEAELGLYILECYKQYKEYNQFNKGKWRFPDTKPRDFMQTTDQ